MKPNYDLTEDDYNQRPPTEQDRKDVQEIMEAVEYRPREGWAESLHRAISSIVVGCGLLLFLAIVAFLVFVVWPVFRDGYGF